MWQVAQSVIKFSNEEAVICEEAGTEMATQLGAALRTVALLLVDETK